MAKRKLYRIVGKVNGMDVIREYENEYSAGQAADQLNEIFAPFSVEAIEQEPAKPVDQIPEAPLEGSPF